MFNKEDIRDVFVIVKEKLKDMFITYLVGIGYFRVGYLSGLMFNSSSQSISAFIFGVVIVVFFMVSLFTISYTKISLKRAIAGYIVVLLMIETVLFFVERI
jgi:hypothetical protein